MAIGLILDDERFIDTITWVSYPDTDGHCCLVRNPLEFISSVRSLVDIVYISFDHDLAWYNKAGRDITGYDCLKWMCRYLDRHPEVKIPQVFFHSKNPIGVANMKGYWYNWLHTQPTERINQ